MIRLSREREVYFYQPTQRGSKAPPLEFNGGKSKRVNINIGTDRDGSRKNLDIDGNGKRTAIVAEKSQ